MQTEIKIHPALAPNWQADIERQLNLALASLHWQVGRVLIELEPNPPNTHHDTTEAGYRCRVHAELRVGRKQIITVVNRDPQISVADAAARLRRAVTRDRQLGLMGRAI